MDAEGACTPEGYHHYLFKIVLAGEQYVGKSALLEQIVNGKFQELYRITYGCEVGVKGFTIMDKRIKCQIYDISGSPRYRAIHDAFFRGAGAAVIVYDVTQRRSFESVREVLNSAKQYGSKSCLTILVGNKTDLWQERVVSTEEGHSYALSNMIDYFTEISCKSTADADRLLFEVIDRMIFGGPPCCLNRSPSTPISVNRTVSMKTMTVQENAEIEDFVHLAMRKGEPIPVSEPIMPLFDGFCSTISASIVPMDQQICFVASSTAADDSPENVFCLEAEVKIIKTATTATAQRAAEWLSTKAMNKAYPSDLYITLFANTDNDIRNHCSDSGTLTVTFELTISWTSEPTVRIQNAIEARATAEDRKTNKWAKLFHTEKSSDCSLIVKDSCCGTSTRTFKAHKEVICAESPVFKAMMESEMREGQEGHTIEINDMDETVCQAMLQFLYTKELEIRASSDHSVYISLLNAAEKYQIDSLKQICSTRLSQLITPANLIDLVQTAELYALPDLMSQCAEFVRHQRTLVESSGWKDFEVEQPRTALKLLKSVIMGTTPRCKKCCGALQEVSTESCEKGETEKLPLYGSLRQIFSTLTQRKTNRV